MSVLVPPALLLVIGAAVVAVLPRAGRCALAVLLPLTALAYAALCLPAGTTVPYPFMSYTLEVVRSDRLALVFAGIFCVTSSLAALYASREADVKQQVAALLYTAGALGVTFAGDLLTLYVFWELLAVTATLLVWAGGTSEATRAGTRYLLVHLTGGAVLLAGIVLHASASGSILFRTFDPGTASLGTWLILAGFCLNAAVPPLHAWLPDAYPRASVTGSVFLAAFTTKTAVYALLRGFAGWEILVAAGVLMALYGVFYAVLASDLRGLLSYHIVSQVGYMVAGAGIGTELAINGATAHAVNHLLYKGLLFMSVGAVIVATGRSNLAELGGLRSRQPLVFALYVIGALSISGVPLWNGFVSKAMVLGAATETHHDWTFLLLMLAAVGTFLSVGLKLPYFVWMGDERGVRSQPTPKVMLVAMAITAGLCTLLGVVPDLLYRFLPYANSYQPYTAGHVLETVQLLLFTFFAFAILLPNLGVARQTLVDLDVVYRKPGPMLRSLFVAGVDALFDAAQRAADQVARGATQALRDPTAWLADRNHGGADFDPDRSRPPLLTPLLVTVATFVAVAIALLSWSRP